MSTLTIIQNTEYLISGYIREFEIHFKHIPCDITNTCIKFYGFIFNFDSNILDNDEDKFKLTHMLVEKININGLSEMKLLYSTISDEHSSKAFYETCKDSAPTLTLIKNDKNYIFGGFTTKKWCIMEHDEDYEYDGDAFLFFLKCNDSNRIPQTYNPIKPEQAIYHAGIGDDCIGYPDFGPWFGDEDIILWGTVDCAKHLQSTYPCKSVKLCGYSTTHYCKNFNYEIFHLIYHQH
eukprot:443026_1